MLSEIKSWLDSKDRDFSLGLGLLEKFSDDTALIRLCSQFRNSFTEEKLAAEIKGCYERNLAREPVGNQISVAVAEGNIKDQVIRLHEERRELFKKALELRLELKKTYPLLYRGQIDLASALDLMDSRDRKGNSIPFSIVAVTFNESQQTGGEILTYPKAQLAVLDKSNRIATGKRAESISRDPNHWINGTRNIMPYGTNEIRKISIWLILQFNEMEVNLGKLG